MSNKKETWEASRTCETGKVFQGIGSFFLMPVYNNRYNPTYYNSKTEITTGVIKNLNTDRVDGETCENSTKQEKLRLRRKPTPYRVPINHYRKTYNETLDTSNCIKNEKIIKVVDNSYCEVINGVLTQVCPKVNYTMSRLVFSDKQIYNKSAKELVNKFKENYKKYDIGDDSILSGGPL